MVAQTITNVLETPTMKAILDKSADLQPVIDELTHHWSYDLYSRKPGPAYDDGVFVGTDLDLACFIFALAERGAVINLPTYKGRRAKTAKEGERVVSADNRHGKITGLSANKEVFSFSVKILDQNAMTTDSVGAHRNFMLVDVDGSWHDGWKRIEFMPTAKENDFLNNNKLWDGATVVFNNFVHPNRWISLYGQYYLMTKALLARMEDEAQYLFSIIKALREKGVTLPEDAEKADGRQEVVGDTKPIKVKSMQVEVDFPEAVGGYPEVEGADDVEKLRNAIQKRNLYIYTLAPKLRFPARATEFAFFQHGDDGNKLPVWISGVQWDRNFKFPRGRTVWNRLELTPELAIRYRVYEKTERVAAD